MRHTTRMGRRAGKACLAPGRFQERRQRLARLWVGQYIVGTTVNREGRWARQRCEESDKLEKREHPQTRLWQAVGSVLGEPLNRQVQR